MPKYKRKNIALWKMKQGSYCVDYCTPSLGRTLNILPTKKQALKYIKKVSK